MALEEIFGFIGGTLISIAMIPQVVRLFKLKSAREISLLFTSLLVIGGIFWLIYGLVLARPSIIYTNVIAVSLSGLMVFAKLKWGRTPVNEKHS